MELTAGELRQQMLLGTEAVYRVCDWTDTLVNVEVIRAPGLQHGQRFTFARETVTKMTVVRSQPDPGNPPERVAG